MKIGMITFHSAHNYGAVLQAWSLQEYLKQQGHQVDVINLRLPVIDKLYRLTYRTKKSATGLKPLDSLLNGIYYYGRCGAIQLMDRTRGQKYRAFEHFIKHRFTLTKRFDQLGDLRLADLKYDALIAGSDQIWNTVMMKGINPAYFLQFGNRDALRISYAASIGTDEIPPQYRELFDCYLRDFDAISVREKKAQGQIQEHTDQNVDVVADPTFLLNREDFDHLKKNPSYKGKYIYVHNVHLKRVDDNLNSVVEEMSKRLNLPVIHNWPTKMFKNEAGHFTGSPEEFLGLVANAEYVVTNSFHCTVFSIIYGRDFITIPHFQNPDRMRNLLTELGIENHLIENSKKMPKDLKELAIDYAQVENRRKEMGEHGRVFLQKSLSMSKKVDDRTFFDYEDKFRCYGCGACKDICPVNAITMESDKQGFWYPAINEELCIHCNKCKKTCIYHQTTSKNNLEDTMPKVYAAYAADDSVLKASTSGGMFTPMYRAILNKQGSVVGAQYDEDMNVVYGIAKDEEGCAKFRGSKYVNADSNTVKPQVKELLENGEYVLFSGNPCQLAALKSYLGKDYDRLFLVEIICHSTTSPKVFKKYREYLEGIYKSKIVSFQFRNKFKGVENPFVVIEFESGSIELESTMTNNFYRAFAGANIQRPSCFQCEFAGLKAGVGDVTIGDYWGIQEVFPEFANDQGTSLLKINTPKGMRLLEEIKDQYVMKESDYNTAFKKNHTSPTLMRASRARLMYYIDDKPIDDLLMTFNPRKKGGLKLD